MQWAGNGYNRLMNVSKEVAQAHQLALELRKHSHSPYSHFAVGAALKIRGADLIGGCNVENASFGATICAERVALHAAVAAHGRIDPEFLVIATGETEATVPCALCLQTMAEFFHPETPIYLANEKAVLKVFRFSELLPHPFRQFEV